MKKTTIISTSEITYLRRQNKKLLAQLQSLRTGKLLLQLENENLAATKILADIIDIIDSADHSYYHRTNDEWWLFRLRKAADEFIALRSFQVEQSVKEISCS